MGLIEKSMLERWEESKLGADNGNSKMQECCCISNDEAKECLASMNKIIITTMHKLPEYCYDCPCHDSEFSRCSADTEGRDSIYRPFWCPLKVEKDDSECWECQGNIGG